MRARSDHSKWELLITRKRGRATSGTLASATVDACAVNAA
jgi:hypothetical protein